jgi:hypothetical protein
MTGIQVYEGDGRIPLGWRGVDSLDPFVIQGGRRLMGVRLYLPRDCGWWHMLPTNGAGESVGDWCYAAIPNADARVLGLEAGLCEFIDVQTLFLCRETQHPAEVDRIPLFANNAAVTLKEAPGWLDQDVWTWCTIWTEDINVWWDNPWFDPVLKETSHPGRPRRPRSGS